MFRSMFLTDKSVVKPKTPLMYQNTNQNQVVKKQNRKKKKNKYTDCHSIEK